MTCPICGKGTQRAHRPFCSKRCGEADLSHWLRGDYAIPSDDPEAAMPDAGGFPETAH